jgi:predicted porin
MRRFHGYARLSLIGAICFGLTAHGQSNASLTRNAAGAKNIGEAGRLTIDTAGQRESDPDGTTWVFETGAQYQVSSRLQILLESVLHERFQPDVGEGASGFGDTEVTISWLLSESNGTLPSLVFGAKAKLPTAGEEIGTGKADYSALLILGKESGELELSLEAEYATFGSLPGERLEDQLLYTVTAEYGVTDFLAAYAEVFGSSAPTATESRSDAALVGVELDYQLSKAAAPYCSFEIDTEGVGSARAGIEWTW